MDDGAFCISMGCIVLRDNTKSMNFVHFGVPRAGTLWTCLNKKVGVVIFIKSNETPLSMRNVAVKKGENQVLVETEKGSWKLVRIQNSHHYFHFLYYTLQHTIESHCYFDGNLIKAFVTHIWLLLEGSGKCLLVIVA